MMRRSWYELVVRGELAGAGGSCAAAVVTCEFLVELRATCVLTLQVSQPPSFFLTNATVPVQEREKHEFDRG